MGRLACKSLKLGKASPMKKGDCRFLTKEDRMMPSPRINVPRDEVSNVVWLMLQEPEVGDVTCQEQSDGKYTVTPHPKKEG